MPATALSHFAHDLLRATELVVLGEALPTGTPVEEMRRQDVLRSAWMFGVGAFDAYFCDAHTDVVAATLIAKNRVPAMTLPEFFEEIRLPVRAILHQYAVQANLRWRMAARRLMDRESVLSLDAVQRLFNRFFRSGQRFFRDLLPAWIAHPDARRELMGIGAARFGRLPPSQRAAATARAQDNLDARFRRIFQRRHDCIHNYDRPRLRPQPMRDPDVVREVLQDIDFLVRRCDEHINREIHEFLIGTGCQPAVIAQVGY